MTILRRTVLTAPLALGVSAALPAWTNRRNIILILVDDLRYDAMGFLRPGLETPNINQLAREGVYFPNAFVTTSLCSPSRATILTGMPMRDHGIVDNNNPEPRDLHFFPQYMQAEGYRTAFVGKWHMGADTDEPRPGFDHWVSFTGQGSYYPTDGFSEEEIAGGKRHALNVDGKRVDQTAYITDELTDYALTWLKSPSERPFFLYLSHKAVHAMFKPSRSHESDVVDAALQKIGPQPEPANQPLWAQDQRNSLMGADFPFNGDAAQLREHERNYLRTLKSVDDSLGRLLEWIRSSNSAHDTAIFFTSDNGFMFGDRGLIDKRVAYEPSIRIPFVGWAPGLFPAGRKDTAMIANLDFSATILDIAGVAKPRQIQGRSFLAEAAGRVPPDGGRKELVYEYYWEFNYPQIPTTFALRTERFKYIQYYGVRDRDELFDIAADPYELKNLIDNEEYLDVKVAMRKRLYEGLADTRGRHSIEFGAKDNAGSVFFNERGRPRAPYPESWKREPGDPDLNLHVVPDSRQKMALIRKRAAEKESGGAIKPRP